MNIVVDLAYDLISWLIRWMKMNQEPTIFNKTEVDSSILHDLPTNPNWVVPKQSMPCVINNCIAPQMICQQTQIGCLNQNFPPPIVWCLWHRRLQHTTFGDGTDYGGRRARHGGATWKKKGLSEGVEERSG
ncbi:hypothetical protein SLA2020_414600 [Shorea laevis]